LRLFFEEVRPYPGNRRTSNVALWFYHREQFVPKFGAVIRMIADLNNSDYMYGAVDTGLT
jgi:hypothetical protein